MNRPYILCNMLTALDGKITGPYMFDEYARKTMDAYDRIHESFGAKAWMCGRKPWRRILRWDRNRICKRWMRKFQEKISSQKKMLRYIVCL